MKKYSYIILVCIFISACAAKQKPIAYNVTIISATIPPEKAPGVPWDEPEKDDGFLSGACKAATIAGTAAGIISGGISLLIGPACSLFENKADPAAPLPDPLVEIITDKNKIILPPMGNTINPVWEQTIQIPYKDRLILRVHLYDNDGKDAEAIGTGSFKPGKAGEDPFEVNCDKAKLLLSVAPVFETLNNEQK